VDTVATLTAIVGRSIPNFVFAVILQLVFGVWLKVLPIALWNEGFRSSILPTIALSISPLPTLPDSCEPKWLMYWEAIM
jgi:oligopeptide transport system permease protein